MSSTLTYDWSKYRKNRLYFILIILATFGILFSKGWLDNYSKVISSVVWFAWGILVVLQIGYKFVSTACPNCGKPVHLKGAFGYPFSPCCLNCGIKIGADPQSRVDKKEK